MQSGINFEMFVLNVITYSVSESMLRSLNTRAPLCLFLLRLCGIYTFTTVRLSRTCFVHNHVNLKFAKTDLWFVLSVIDHSFLFLNAEQIQNFDSHQLFWTNATANEYILLELQLRIFVNKVCIFCGHTAPNVSIFNDLWLSGLIVLDGC